MSCACKAPLTLMAIWIVICTDFDACFEPVKHIYIYVRTLSMCVTS